MVLLIALLGCRNKDLGVDTSGIWTVDSGALDLDGDGWPAGEDCDDEDPLVHPDANEVCNGLDDDCNDIVDDAVGDLWYLDADGDTFGDPLTEALSCEGEGGQVADATDCDDSRADVYPGAEELCDLADNDCDGDIDEEVELSWYLDADLDGWGTEDEVALACEPPEGFVAESTDCDDADPEVHPEADELCNNLDDDCDGDTDEEALDSLTFYADSDLDGYGAAGASVQACEPPEGYLDDATDCDDQDNDVHPGADELCNDEDDDCDGTIDEDDALDALTWYTDGDSDGYGDPTLSTLSCEQPSGSVDNDEDCDDSSADVSPDADEECDGVDNDCDGDTDEDDAIDADTWYEDGDEDGYGDLNSTTTACAQPSGYTDDATDCDDNDDDINPSADEVCNGDDDDCDGTTDEDDAIDAQTWYVDGDGDGFGDSATSTQACSQPSGYDDDDDDCDDGDSAINPDATEVCDGEDNDCSGATDEGYTDTDGDGDANCVDASVWDYDFSTGSLSDWSIVNLGGSNNPSWSISNGAVVEASNAANTLLLGPDLGEMDTWTFSVDAWIGGAATDYLGLVFDYQDSSNYWVARVNDPTGYYSRFSPTGQVELIQCVAGTCSTVASDSTVDFTLAYNTVVVLAVSADGADITVSWDGNDVLTYTASSSPVGANTIGFYSNDNDSGSYYSDPVVTNP